MPAFHWEIPNVFQRLRKVGAEKERALKTTLRFSHTGERETRKTRECLLTKCSGPWPVFSFPPSFARKFSSRERQGLEQAKISKYSMHPSLFCLRSSFSQSPSRANKIKCYLQFLCPSYSYMVGLLICNQLSHVDIIPIPFLQKSTAVMISFAAVQTLSRGGSRGRVQGVRTPPPRWPAVF